MDVGVKWPSLSVADQTKIIDLGETIQNTYGNPAQIEFSFDNDRILEGELFEACINYLDERDVECKSVVNSPLARPEIVTFGIGCRL